ncbi:MAG: helix-turn-helix domain-containing protein [Candidatus Omnitrophota bacterium]|nr:MAG: helix-turn-helix domain-containing protein [Candidatus Omnitrophota bacterium]
MEDAYMTIKELARYLKVKQSTVYNWVNNERIPASKVVGQWRFRRNEIDSWVKDSKKKAKIK